MASNVSTTLKRSASQFEVQCLPPPPRVCKLFTLPISPRMDIAIGLLDCLPTITLKQNDQPSFHLSIIELEVLCQSDFKEGAVLSQERIFNLNYVTDLVHYSNTFTFRKKVFHQTAGRTTPMDMELMFSVPESAMDLFSDLAKEALQHIQLILAHEPVFKAMFSVILTRMNKVHQTTQKKNSEYFEDIYRIVRQSVPVFMILKDYHAVLKTSRITSPFDHYSLFDSCMCQIRYLKNAFEIGNDLIDSLTD